MLYAATYGSDEPVTQLIPAMLASFLDTDRAYLRAPEIRALTSGPIESIDVAILDCGNAGRPISVRIATAVMLTGISRSRLYELIQSGDLKVVKIGRSTLIPFQSLKRLIAPERDTKR